MVFLGLRLGTGAQPNTTGSAGVCSLDEFTCETPDSQVRRGVEKSTRHLGCFMVVTLYLMKPFSS